MLSSNVGEVLGTPGPESSNSTSCMVSGSGLLEWRAQSTGKTHSYQLCECPPTFQFVANTELIYVKGCCKESHTKVALLLLNRRYLLLYVTTSKQYGLIEYRHKPDSKHTLGSSGYKKPGFSLWWARSLKQYKTLVIVLLSYNHLLVLVTTWQLLHVILGEKESRQTQKLFREWENHTENYLYIGSHLTIWLS